MRLLTSIFVLSVGTAGLASCSSDVSEPSPSCEGDNCDSVKDVLNADPLKECGATDLEDVAKIARLSCTPCGDAITDMSGRGVLPEFIANDALMKHVYMTFEDTDGNKKLEGDEIDCPIDFVRIQAKLEKFDTENCNGIKTQVVSETAALFGKSNADYRAVTTRDCDGRGQHGLMFSSFGWSGRTGAKGSGFHVDDKVGTGGLAIEDLGSEDLDIEIIAFDKTEGIFNYYKEVDGGMRFFGSSLDFVAAGPGGPSLTSTRGCANCHPGGGIIQKELQSPWTHWSQEDDIVGADELVANRSEFMGTLTSGANMQFSVVQPGNEAWNKRKVDFFESVTKKQLEDARELLVEDRMSAAERADLERRQLIRPEGEPDLTPTQKLLEPLFCSVQVNIVSGGSFGVPSALMANGRHGVSFSGNVVTNQSDYEAAIAAIGNAVGSKPDASNEFLFIERSHEDTNYIERLVSKKIINAQFVKDVLMVDFTRPVFSDDRCGLIAFVPDLTPAKRTLPNIRKGLTANLRDDAGAEPKDGTPAGELLFYLEASADGNSADHAAALQRYSDACSARDGKDVLSDALKIRGLNRKLAFGDGVLDDADGPGQHMLNVFEFDFTMPSDDITVRANAAADNPTSVRPDARFSPSTCELISSFEPVAAAE